MNDSLPLDDGRNWVRACLVSDIPADEGFRLLSVPPTAVFLQDGEVFCTDDTCTHETFSLAEGWVEECIVECTLHNAKFSLRTGEVLSPPAVRPLAVHPAVVRNDVVYVALPVSYLVKAVTDATP